MGNVISRNIKVSNSPDKPLYVDVIDPSATGNVLNIYQESLSIAGSATATILTYTVPVGKYFVIKRIDYSGSSKGTFTIDINSNVESKQRLYCTSFNGSFQMENLKIVAGDTIKLIVENNTNNTANYNGNLIGNLDNA